MSNEQIKAQLARAAAQLRGRNLTAAEQSDLLRFYLEAQGTSFERSLKSLARATNMTPGEIRVKQANDDNVDRTIRDLENILRDR